MKKVCSGGLAQCSP